MRLIGALLLLGGAGLWCLLRRREGMLPVRVGRALLEDLAVFSYQIRVRRTPLPELLEEVLAQGLGAEYLWRPLAERLAEEGASLPRCWRESVRTLPEPLGKLLLPLGPLLPEGGGPLAKAVEETREELTGFLREETARQASQGRINAALSMAGACLAILVLL
ncbi:MAG: hypothetical protein K2P15_04005 [Oscillospiraceae bacterium]|jgi:hypothetical protein|nr:hypothetical protein [Oscillospiraceae bacterium]